MSPCLFLWAFVTSVLLVRSLLVLFGRGKGLVDRTRQHSGATPGEMYTNIHSQGESQYCEESGWGRDLSSGARSFITLIK
jgi:hypothetical protein